MTFKLNYIMTNYVKSVNKKHDITFVYY